MGHVQKLLALAAVVAGASGVSMTRIPSHVHFLTLIKGGIGVPCGSTSQRVCPDPSAVTCPACRESREWKEAVGI